MGPFEKATAFASGPWAQIHGHCHQRNVTAQNKHLTQAHGDSLRSWKDSITPLLNVCSVTSPVTVHCLG